MTLKTGTDIHQLLIKNSKSDHPFIRKRLIISLTKLIKNGY
jgi:hypothetical protein